MKMILLSMRWLDLSSVFQISFILSQPSAVQNPISKKLLSTCPITFSPISVTHY